MHQAADGYAVGVRVGDRDPTLADGKALGMADFVALTAREVNHERLKGLTAKHFSDCIGIHERAS
jgi:hypothetical protein